MKKQVILIVLMSSMMIVSTAATAQSQKVKAEISLNNINLKVNGTSVQSDNILYNESTYVPLRKVAEMFGKEVDWDADTNTADIQDKGSKLSSNYNISFVAPLERYKIQAMRTSQQYSEQKESEHFIVYYNTNGRAASNDKYVEKVLKEFENAYNVYFNQMGIWIPLDGKIPVSIDDLGENIGAASSQFTPDNNFMVKIIIGPNVPDDIIGGDIHHELFHIIQSIIFT